jgi:anti-sigma regulatory factor (Ser/Thr protein kinase)
MDDTIQDDITYDNQRRGKQGVEQAVENDVRHGEAEDEHQCLVLT